MPGGKQGAAVPVWQEGPIQPGGQAHLPGKEQRPPFWHGTWHRAVRANKHSITRWGCASPFPCLHKHALCTHVGQHNLVPALGMGCSILVGLSCAEDVLGAAGVGQTGLGLEGGRGACNQHRSGEGEPRCALTAQESIWCCSMSSSGGRLAADVLTCSAFALRCTSQCPPESISLPLLLIYMERTCSLYLFSGNSKVNKQSHRKKA